MPKPPKALQEMSPPVSRAMVFVCEKCSKRNGGEDKHASHKIASKLKRRVKHQFGKGEIRVVLTSCMDACPEDGIAISVQTVIQGTAALFLEADPADVEGSSEALMKVLGRQV